MSVARSSSTVIRIGTRKSPLALAQAHEVRNRLITTYPEFAAQERLELVPITTSGDRIQDRPLADAGGKGLFTKEIEEALLAGSIDMAVHSLKDVPTQLPPGLMIACTLPREDARDALIAPQASFADLPRGVRLGTSSPRRAALALMQRPDIRIVPMRGNVHTRLAKLKAGEADATLLAMAGLKRLAIRPMPGVPLEPENFLPAVAQGVIGIECLESNDLIRTRLAPLSHLSTEQCVQAERAMLAVLDGSCRTPIAGFAAIENGVLTLRALIAAPDGGWHRQACLSAAAQDALRAGREVGRMLLESCNKPPDMTN